MAKQVPNEQPVSGFPGESDDRENGIAPGMHRRIRLPVPRNRTDLRLLALDVVALAVFGLIVLGNRHRDSLLEGVAALVGAVIVVFFLEVAGLYRNRLSLSALDDLPRIAAWTVVGFALACSVIEPYGDVGRAAIGVLIVIAMLFTLRAIYYAVVRDIRRRSEPARTRTAVVGGGRIGAELIKITRARPEYGLDVVVAITDDPLQELVDTGIEIEAGLGDTRKHVEHHRVGAVLVAFSSSPDSSMVGPLRDCDELDCEIFIVPRLFEFVPLTKDMDRLHTIPLIRMRRDALRTWYWKAKRIFDLVTVSVALLIFSPVIAAVAAAVFLSDPRAPIIFRQKRIGRRGVPFEVLKFRSMRPVASTTSDSEWQPSQRDRIGPVGRFIRKTSLDELPQLWNVFRGDMSIVGPRPERPHFVEQFESSVPSYRDRHRVPAGLTGWAAINGLRGDTSITDRAIYDNFYIENWSVWLDIKIIVRTVGAVLRGTGG